MRGFCAFNFLKTEIRLNYRIWNLGHTSHSVSFQMQVRYYPSGGHTSFNIKNFYLVPTERASVFLWTSEQTAIIFLYGFNWLVL